MWPILSNKVSIKTIYIFFIIPYTSLSINQFRHIFCIQTCLFCTICNFPMQKLQFFMRWRQNNGGILVQLRAYLGAVTNRSCIFLQFTFTSMIRGLLETDGRYVCTAAILLLNNGAHRRMSAFASPFGAGALIGLYRLSVRIFRAAQGPDRTCSVLIVFREIKKDALRGRLPGKRPLFISYLLPISSVLLIMALTTESAVRFAS